MQLNPDMLAELKEIIYKKSKLPETVQEPVHIVAKSMAAMEFAYGDFLSREICGEVKRANPIISLIEVHGGDSSVFKSWFLKYENLELVSDDDMKTLSASGVSTVRGAWAG